MNQQGDKKIDNHPLRFREECKRAISITFVVFALGLLVGCAKDPPVGPTQTSEESSATNSAQRLATELVALTEWAVDANMASDMALQRVDPLTSSQSGCSITLGQWLGPVERFVLAGDVVHYRFRLRVGPGPHDVIGIHRVVREHKPNQPIKTGANLFLIHGDYKDFEGCFLPGFVSSRRSDDFGFAVYLAQNNVDVWGIDHAWTLVPASETDFSFMAGWGMQRMVDELSIAVAVARMARVTTGNGAPGMLLCGYSSGSTTGFALLNQETHLPPGCRDVTGFVPVDQGVITNIPEWAAAMSGAVEGYQNLIDGGQYQDYNPLLAFGTPAAQDPAGASALIPGFTNLQAALALGVFPFFAGVSSHFLGGTFDADGVPTGLQYSNVNDWIDFMTSAPAYEPLAYERDEYITSCTNAGTFPWNDHLGQIRVPVLYVMAGGGFGYTGEHTLDVLGSTDITRLKVSLHPPSEAAVDFAHIDLFLGNRAPELVWKPMLAWIRSHIGGRP